MNRKKSVISDVFNDAMSEVAYVSQIQILLDFHGRLDPTILQKALYHLLKTRGTLGYRFVRRFLNPYWEALADETLQKASQVSIQEVTAETLDGATEQILAQSMDHCSEPQLRAILLNTTTAQRLVLKVNHMAADAAATKEVAYALAKAYNSLLAGQPLPQAEDRSRSLSQVFRHLPKKRYPALFGSYIQDIIDNSRYPRSLSFSSKKVGWDPNAPLAFVRHTLPREVTTGLRALREREGFTLNDLLLGAMIHSVIALRGYREGEALRVMGTVDLRRYIPSGRGETFCNLSSFFFPRLGYYGGETPLETMRRVKARIDELKEKEIGLGFMFGSMAMLGHYPFGVKRKIIQTIFRHLGETDRMGTALTNLGVLEPERLEFGGVRPSHGEVVVPACIPPSFFMGVSGFDGALVLTMGFDTGAFDREEVVSLMGKMERILRSLQEEEKSP